VPEYNGTLEGLLETYLLQATSIQTQCTERYVLIFSACVLQTPKRMINLGLVHIQRLRFTFIEL